MSEDPREAERATYVSEVEDFFLRRRGSARLLPPKDLQLALDWFEEGIPLAVVLAAVGEVFAKNEARGAVEPVSSLTYCRHAVKKRWLEVRGGGPGVAPRPAPQKPRKREASPLPERLRSAAERIGSGEPAVAGALLRVVPAVLRILAGDGSVSAREAELLAVEAALHREILAALPEEVRAALVEEAEEPLARLRVPPSPEERERLVALGVARVLRSRWALPKLTLL